MNPFSASDASNVIFAGCFISTAILAIGSFGQPALFDSVITLLLVIIILFYFHDKDVVSVLAITLVDRLLGIAFFELPQASDLAKVFIYGLSFLVCLVFRYQGLARFTLLSLLITVPAEIYWLKVEYPAPFIYFYYIVLMQIIIARYCFFQRVGLFRRWFDTRHQVIDARISDVYLCSGVINILMVFEYLVRHLSGFNVLLVYTSFEYVQQILTVIFTVTILFYTVSHPRYLRA